MCVIIVNETGKQINRDILETAETLNPHGFGITFLDNFKTYKDVKSSAWTLYINDINQGRPYIAHFRYATVGEVSKKNCHPFTFNDGRDCIFSNGTIKTLGNSLMTDTEHLSIILQGADRSTWRDICELTDNRFAVVDAKKGVYDIYNLDMWTQHEGVLYSKNDVIEYSIGWGGDDDYWFNKSPKKHLVAVYGTLKVGNGNFYSLLGADNYTTSGVTVNKYPMLSNGIPYVSSKPSVDGNHISVDIMKVSDEELADLDRLEGHPDWYKRETTEIELSDGSIISAWLYFNDTVDFSEPKNYISEFSKVDKDDYPRILADMENEGGFDWWDEEEVYTFEGDEVKAVDDCPSCKNSNEVVYDDSVGLCYCHSCTSYIS